MSPIPKDVQDALAQEAIEREIGKQAPRPANNADRLTQAASTLSAALAAAQGALSMFMAIYTEGRASQAEQAKALDRLRDLTKHKTFNQHVAETADAPYPPNSVEG